MQQAFNQGATPKQWTRIWRAIGVALLYVICARIGQIFSIHPGNVTPVWIPSGIMLALALRFGPSIWPGVFAGAFLGNIWAYFDPHCVEHILRAFGSATLNGIGDVISTVVAAQLIVYFSHSTRILNNEKTLFAFIMLGAVIGPLISALFGVGGLAVFAFIETENIELVFKTWWIGDGVGAILFTPFLLSWLYKEKNYAPNYCRTLIAIIAYCLLATATIFELIILPSVLTHVTYLLLPLLFVILFRSGQRIIFSVQVAVVSLAIIATSLKLGPFVTDAAASQLTSLTQLQLFAAIFSFVLFIIALLHLEKTRNEEALEKRTIELEELYRKDALTKLWNRYYISEFLEIQLNQCARHKRPIGVLMLDIDNFKKLNDQYGHLKGDEILTQLSTIIKDQVRCSDLLGRWGGEEFIIIAIDATEDSLASLSKKIQGIIANHRFSVAEHVTLSIGGALWHESDSELTLIDRADGALYVAKNSGKNQFNFNDYHA